MGDSVTVTRWLNRYICVSEFIFRQLIKYLISDEYKLKKKITSHLGLSIEFPVANDTLTGKRSKYGDGVLVS